MNSYNQNNSRNFILPLIFESIMNTFSFSIFYVVYAIFVLILLDSGIVGSRTERDAKKEVKSKPSTCPENLDSLVEFQMKMALCRPNISVVCAAEPNSPCFKNQSKLKTTAFVHRRNGQCIIESNVTSTKTLRFYVEAKHVINPNEEGSRSLGSQQEHQRGKCLLKYICQKRFIRSITMECGSVFANETGALTNFTRQRTFWLAPSNYKGFVHFSAEISSDKPVLNISSAKIFIPGMEQQEINSTGKDGNGNDKT